MKKISLLTTIILLIVTTVCNAGRSRAYIFKNSRMINGDAHSAGGSHSLEIRNGQLWAWGSNQYGQLGDGTINGSLIPEHIGNATNWIAVAAGTTHSIGLKSDGTLWAWGYNNFGQIGNGNTIDQHSPIQIGTDNKWISIACAIE